MTIKQHLIFLFIAGVMIFYKLVGGRAYDR